MQTKTKQTAILAALFVTILSTALSTTAQAKSVDVPQEVVEISEQLGGQYNICPELIQAICWRESLFTADAEGGGCIGIMQISPKWHKDRMKRLGVTDLYDVRQNMTVGVDYLSELSESGDDIAKVLMEYHGESDVEERLERGEVSSYAAEILELSEKLEMEKEERK